ncbi:hypothetical protein Pelo_18117 [Pelomyxa schiedti]|nr:hypothetical protein Pelo_18117 [Pelomyxa schiedti]
MSSSSPHSCRSSSGNSGTGGCGDGEEATTSWASAWDPASSSPPLGGSDGDAWSTPLPLPFALTMPRVVLPAKRGSRGDGGGGGDGDGEGEYWGEDPPAPDVGIVLEENVSEAIPVAWFVAVQAVVAVLQRGEESRALNAANLWERALRTKLFQGFGGSGLGRRGARGILDALAAKGFLKQHGPDGMFSANNGQAWDQLCSQSKRLMIRKQKNIQIRNELMMEHPAKYNGNEQPEEIIKRKNTAHQCWDPICTMPHTPCQEVFHILTIELMKENKWGPTLKFFFKSQSNVEVQSITPSSQKDLENLTNLCRSKGISPEAIDVLIVVVHGLKLFRCEANTRKERKWVIPKTRDANAPADWDGMPYACPQFANETPKTAVAVGDLYRSITSHFPAVALVIWDSCLTLFSERRCNALRPFIQPNHRFMSWKGIVNWKDSAAREKAHLQEALDNFRRYVEEHHTTKMWATESGMWRWNDSHLLRLCPLSGTPLPPPSAPLRLHSALVCAQKNARVYRTKSGHPQHHTGASNPARAPNNKQSRRGSPYDCDSDADDDNDEDCNGGSGDGDDDESDSGYSDDNSSDEDYCDSDEEEAHQTAFGRMPPPTMAMTTSIATRSGDRIRTRWSARHSAIPAMPMTMPRTITTPSTTTKPIPTTHIWSPGAVILHRGKTT